MRLLSKFKKKKQKLLDQYNRGKQVTMDLKVERREKRLEKLESMSDGTWKRMQIALHNNTSIKDFLSNELSIRKQIRDEKYKE